VAYAFAAPGTAAILQTLDPQKGGQRSGVVPVISLPEMDTKRSLGKITKAECDCAVEVGWGKAHPRALNLDGEGSPGSWVLWTGM
jgi:hypothetical protein